MFISIHDLVLQKVEFDEKFAPGRLELGTEIEQKGPIQSKGRAELLEEHHGGKTYVQDIRVVGNFHTDVELRCARCLEAVAMHLGGEFDLLYRPLATVTTGEEVAITDADAEISYYQGDGIQLEDVVKEQVLLSAPLRVLCAEDCKGLCPQCGRNKNASACECVEVRTDPRWDALAELKNKLKQ